MDLLRKVSVLDCIYWLNLFDYHFSTTHSTQNLRCVLVNRADVNARRKKRGFIASQPKNVFFSGFSSTFHFSIIWSL